MSPVAPVAPAAAPRPVASAVAPVTPTTVPPASNGPVQSGTAPSPAPASPGVSGGSEVASETVTDESKPKRGRRKLSDSPLAAHPLLNVNAEGKATTPLESVPADYDPKIHRPLGRSEFKSEATFLRWKAGELRKKADEYETEAKQLELLGNAEDQASAKKLINHAKKLEELLAQLGEKGIDTAKLLEAAKGGKK